jgi:hypothetical protein
MTTKYDNSGTVYVNDRKEKDTHPDRTGTATINGVDYWVSGWIKQPDKSKPPFLSLAFKVKEAATQKAAGGKQYKDDADQIPF